LCISILGVFLIFSCSLDTVKIDKDQEQITDSPDVTRGKNGNGRITNNTGEPILVYGTYEFEHSGSRLFKLYSGDTTPDYFDCDGFYVPSNRKTNLYYGPHVIKILDTCTTTISLSGDQYTGSCWGLRLWPGMMPGTWDPMPSGSTAYVRRANYKSATNQYCGYFKITVEHEPDNPNTPEYDPLHKVLDVGGGDWNKANVQQWQWKGGNNQKWMVRYEESKGSDYYFSLQAAHSADKYLMVDSTSGAYGSGIYQHQKDPANKGRHLWKLERIYGEREDMFCKILSYLNTNHCVDVKGALKENGVDVFLWYYKDQVNQKWAFDWQYN
jgi:hypothetical protein